jgi:flagellar basal-body rod modification protein FlgD
MTTTSTISPATAGPLAATTATTSTTAAGTAASLQIDPSQFLTLITAQMQDQNPLEPTDPTQFLSQLEGLSEVSSLQGLQTTLASSMQASQMSSGTALLGHTVLASGSTATLAAGGTVSGAVSAPSGATSLTVAVTDASGALVDSFSVAPQPSGLTPFTWNGTSSGGAAAPPGQYTVSVIAGAGSSNQVVTPLIASQVQSVTIDPTSQALDLNTTNGTIPLSSVVGVQ